MPTYGVTPQGFVVKPLDVCLQELEDLARATFGAGINLDPSSRWGQFLGTLAGTYSELWDKLQESYQARDPDQATGASLEGICALTGTLRRAATRSKVVATLGGNAGTVVAAGKIASVDGTGVRFRLVAEVTIGGGGTVAGNFEAEDTGPLPAPAGTLTHIETPVAGWNTVTNPLDADPGSDVEADPVLRVRRENELSLAGAGALDAVKAEVSGIVGVAAALGFENTSMVTNGDGMPPKSIEILASGGADQDIANAIWRTKGGGIETHGTETAVVVDASGTNQTVKFSRPADVEIFLKVGIQKNADYPADGDAQIKAALVAYGDANYGVGDDVYPRALIPSVIGVAGVYNVPHVYAGLAVDPASENPIAIAARSVALLDTARIVVEYV